ncbi:MAG: hypothetical protein ACEQSR_06825 [Candidatus Methylacidiphilales bacterium]
MTPKEEIESCIKNKLGQFRNNVSVFETATVLDLTNISKGILIIYSFWSGRGLSNIYNTLDMLYKSNYQGQIIVLDHDGISLEFQKTNFGQLFEGWGEIFSINLGKITQSYFGRDSFEKFEQTYQG